MPWRKMHRSDFPGKEDFKWKDLSMEEFFVGISTGGRDFPGLFEKTIKN